MSSTSIDGLLKLIAATPTAPGASTSTLGSDATFGTISGYDGEIEKTTFDKGAVSGPGSAASSTEAALLQVEPAIKSGAVKVKEVSNENGKVIVLEATAAALAPEVAAVNELNSRPAVLNKHLRKHLAKAQGVSTSSTSITAGLDAMTGGSFQGEFEAIKNVHALEKQTIDMIGGGSKWAPALAPEATSRSKTFRQLLNRLVKDLAANGKALDGMDKATLESAIDALEKHERSAYTKLAYLKKYSALVQKHKDTDDKAIEKALKTKNIEDFVTEYMHTLKRVDRKSSKLWGAMGALVAQAGPFLVVV